MKSVANLLPLAGLLFVLPATSFAESPDWTPSAEDRAIQSLSMPGSVENDTTRNLDQTAGVWDFELLNRSDDDDDDGGNGGSSGCETAYAFGETELDDIVNSNRWGWQFAVTRGATVVQDIWAAAGNNNTSNGSLVGQLTATYNSNTNNVDVTYQMSAGYSMTETHLYVGENNITTSAPGQYGNQHENLNNVSTDTYSINMPSAPAEVKIVAHAVVCGVGSLGNGGSGGSGCAEAFMQGDYTLSDNFNSNQWGWFNSIKKKKSKNKDFWIGGSNTTSNNTKVGKVKVNYKDDKVKVEFDMESGYTLTAFNIYVGENGTWPQDGSSNGTVDPSFYGHQQTGLNEDDKYTVEIPWDDSYGYAKVIVQGTVCWGGGGSNQNYTADLGHAPNSVAENQPAGTSTGTLSLTILDGSNNTVSPSQYGTPVYTLVDGSGDTDNGSFYIDGDQLRTVAPLDYETKSTYSVRVKGETSSDPGLAGGHFDVDIYDEASSSEKKHYHEYDDDYGVNHLDIINDSNLKYDDYVGSSYAHDVRVEFHNANNGSGTFFYTVDGVTTTGNTQDGLTTSSFDPSDLTALKVTFTNMHDLADSEPSDSQNDVANRNGAFSVRFYRHSNNELIYEVTAYHHDDGSTPAPTTWSDEDVYTIQITNDPSDDGNTGGGGNCETAFAYKNQWGGELDDQVNTNQWGWYFKVHWEETYTVDLWAGATNNNTANGTKIGHVTAAWYNSGLTVTYQLDPGYKLDEVNLDLNQWPSHISTADPDQFDHQVDNLNGVSTYTFSNISIPNNWWYVYITAHAAICEESDSDPVLDAIADQTTPEDTAKTITVNATDQDGDTVTFSATSDTNNVTVSVIGDQLTMTPAANWNGVAVITVTADDGNGGTDVEDFFLTVTPVNDPPVLSPIGDRTTPEDTPKTITVSASDVDGDNITYTATSSNPNVTCTVNGDQLTMTPAGNWTGTSTITVTADDGNGGTDTEDFVLTVTPVNDPPAIESIPDQTTPEDTPKTITISSIDPDSANVTYTGNSSNQNVTVTVNGDQVTMTPADDWNGNATITITANDGNGGTNSEQFLLTVTPVNDAPELATIPDKFTPEDTPKTITVSATDVDGDSLTYSATCNSNNVTVTMNGNQLTMTPALNWTGTLSITVTVNDGNGGTDSETFDLTVSPVPESPEMDAIANQTTPEDTALTIGVNATDPDGDTITYSATSSTANVTVSMVGNQLTMTPAQDWNGPAIITVYADDGTGNSDSTDFQLTVTPVNDDPVLAAIGNQTTPEDTPISLTLSATDVDGDTLTYFATVESGFCTASVNGSQLTLTPDADWSGTATITVSVIDGNGGTDEETFDLVVTEVNDDPVCDPIGDQTTPEDVELVIPLTVTCDEGPTNATCETAFAYGQTQLNNITNSNRWGWQITVANGETLVQDIYAGAGQNNLANGTLVGQLTVSYIGSTVTATYVMSSGFTMEETHLYVGANNVQNSAPGSYGNQHENLGGVTTDTYQINVTPGLADMKVVAHAVVCGNGNNGGNNCNLTCTATVNSGNVTATVANGNLVITPAPNWNGAASITLTCTDGNGGSCTENFTCTVTPVNDPPVLDPIPNPTCDEDTSVSVPVIVSDLDGDNVTCTVAINSGNVTSSFNNGLLTIIPAPNWNGTANLTITCSDGNGGQDQQTITCVVVPVNDAPDLEGIPNQTCNEDTSVTVDLVHTDIEGDNVTCNVTVTSGNVTAVIVNGDVLITPAANWNGTANLSVACSDGNGGTDVETFICVVVPVNDPPVLSPIGNQTCDEDDSVTINLTCTDIDGDNTTESVVVNSGNVTAVINNGQLVITPDANWTGTAQLTVTCSDGNGGTDTETFNCEVVPVNDPPVLAPIGNQSCNEDSSVTVAVVTTDPDGDAVTCAVLVNSGNVTAVLSNGQLTITPAANWNGTANLTVTCEDGNGGSDSETFDCVVIPVNDMPELPNIGGNGNQTTPEDTPLTLTLVATDEDGDTLAYTATSDNANVTVAVTPAGELTMTPAANWNGGPVEITLNVTDGNGGSDSLTFDLTVTPVNDAPVLATIGNQSTQEDTPKVLTISATDVENDNITYTALVVSGDVFATLNGTQLTLTPAANWTGVAQITVAATDIHGAADSETFNLTVIPVNDSPVLSPIVNQTTPEDTPLTITVSATDEEGNPITYSATSGNANVVVTVNGNQVTMTPADDWNGNGVTITVTASDDFGGSDSTTFSLDVTPVDDPPELAPIGNQTTAEDTPLTLTLSASDIENDTLTYYATVDAGFCSAVVSGNDLLITPDADWAGTATITVTVSDGNGGIDDETFDCVVTPVNDDPECTELEDQTTPEDTVLTLPIDVTCDDGPGNATCETAFAFGQTQLNNITNANRWGWQITVLNGQTLVQDIWAGAGQNNTANGTLVGQLTVSYIGDKVTATYQMNAGFTMEETHLYAGPNDVTNSAPGSYGNQHENLGGVTTDIYEITVTPGLPDMKVVAHAVVCGNGGNGGNNNCTVTCTATSNNPNVSVTINNGNLVITPAANYNGQASITLACTDSNGGSCNQTFTCTVTPVNDDPVLGGIGNQSCDEDTNVTVNLTCTDIDGDSTTETVTVNSGNVTATIVNGVLTITPAANWNGTANLTVSCTDGNGGTDSETFDCVVNPVNDDPVLDPIGNQTCNEDSSITVNLNCTDIDGDNTTETVTCDNPNVTVVIVNGELIITPAPNWNGNCNVTVTCNDGNGGTDQETFVCTVVPVNDPPVIDPIGNQTCNEDETITVNVTCNDIDGDTTTETVTVISGNCTATLVNGVLVVTPAPNFNGTCVIQITCNDGNGGIDVELVNCTVNPVNDPPVITTIPDQSCDEDSSVNVTVVTIDDDGDNVTCTVVVNSGNCTATLVNGVITITPAPNWNGTANLTFTCTDGNGGTDTQTFNCVVNPVNDDPVLVQIPDQTCNEDGTVSVNVSFSDIDGDNTTESVSVISGNCTATLVNGVITITPAPNTSGVCVIQVTCNDGNGGVDVITFNCTVNPVNDPPVIDPIADQTCDEDSSITVPVVTTDPDGDTVTCSVSDNSDDVTVTLANGEITITPDANWTGTVTITVTCEDGNGGSDTEFFDCVVEPINDAPVFGQCGDVTTPEDTPIVVTVPATDTEGDTLTYSGTSSNPNVTVTVGVGGQFTLTPALNWNGQTTITINVTDGNGGSDSLSFVCTVTPVNDPPVLAPIGNQTTPEDTPLTLTLSATDVENDTLTFSATVDSGNVTVTINNGDLTITPAPNWNGTATITVTVNDGNGGTDSETFDCVVEGVNDAPVFGQCGDVTTPEDTAITVTVPATDDDGDALTFSGTSSNPNVTVTVGVGGQFTLTPAQDWNGQTTITITVSDGNGGTDSLTFLCTVTPVNDPPVLALIGNQSTPEDTPKVLTLSATDVENDTLTFSANVDSDNVTASVVGDVLTLTPANNWSGVATITVTVSDGNGGTDTETFTLTVDSTNDAPEFGVCGDQTTPEDTPISVTVPATDGDGDNLTYGGSSSNPNVTVTVGVGGQFALTPALNWNGQTTITITVNDGNGGSDSLSFLLTVTPVNDPPVLDPIGNQTTPEDTPVVLNLSATDVENDALTYTANVDSGNVTATVVGNVLTLAPAANWSGVATITVTVDDGNGGTDTETFTLTVDSVNDTPVFGACGDQTTPEDTPITVTVPATDDDGDNLTYSATSASPNVSITIGVGGQFTLVPALNWFGQTTITLNVTDGNGGTDSLAFILTVTPVNDAPVLDAIGNQTTTEDTPKILVLNATDVENDSLTYTATVDSGNVTATVVGNALTLTPAANWSGVATITVTVNDGNGGTDSETFTLTVDSNNDAPVFGACGDVTTPEDTPLSITVAATDSDGDNLTYSGTSSNPNVTVTVGVGGQYTLTPAQDWNGQTTITITVTDGNGGTDSMSFLCTVTPVNDPPVLAQIGNHTIPEDSQLSLILSATDVENDILTFFATLESGFATLDLVGNNLVITPLANWSGTVTITVTVSDGNGGFDEETFDVIVNEVNDDPVCSTIFDLSTPEDTPLTLPFTVDCDHGPGTATCETAFAFGQDELNDLTNSNRWGWQITVADGQTLVQDIWAGAGQNNTANGTLVGHLTVSYIGDKVTATYTMDAGFSMEETHLYVGENNVQNSAPGSYGNQHENLGGVTTDVYEITVTPGLANMKVVAHAVVCSDDDGGGDENCVVTCTATSSNPNVTVTIVDGTLVITPAPDWTGQTTITFTCTDSHGGSSTQTFTCTVTPVNDDPILDPIGNQSCDEDTTITVNIGCSDVDGDICTTTVVVNSGNCTAVIVNGVLVVTPAPNWYGNCTLTVTCNDGNGGTDVEVITCTVNPVNDAPAIDPIVDQTCIEDSNIVVNVLCTDVDGDNTTTTVTVDNPNVTVVIINGQIIITPVPNWYGNCVVTVTCNDGNGGVNIINFNCTITPVNDPPVLDPVGNLTCMQDTSVSVAVTCSDIDGDVCTSSVVVLSGNCTATIVNGILTITPAPGFFGTCVLVVTCDDGNGGTDAETITCTVTHVNNPPVIDPIPDQTFPEDTSVTVTVVSTDPDGDDISCTASVVSGNITLALANGELTVTPIANWFGVATISVTCTDEYGASDTETFTCTVTPVSDDFDIADIPDQTTPEDTPLSIPFPETDLDGNPITCNITVSSNNVTVVVVNGQLIMTPALHWSGVVTITIDCTCNGESDSTTFTLTVTPVNDPPVLDPIGNQTCPEDGSITINLSASDPDGDTLTFSYHTDSDFCVVTLVGNVLTIVPNPNYSGTITITVTVSDGNGGIDSETFVVVVSGDNDPPTFQGCLCGDLTTLEDTPLAHPLFATDPDGDTLTYTFTINSGQVNVTQLNGNSIFTPAPNWHGVANITLTVNDGFGGTASVTFNLTVIPVNDAPVLSPIGFQATLINTPKVIDLQASDVDGDTLSFTATVLSGNVSASISGSQLTITPAGNWIGTATLTVGVSDGNITDLESFPCNVTTDSNGPSGLTLDPSSIPENEPSNTLIGTLTAVDPDQNDTHTYQVVGGQDQLLLHIVGDKLYSSQPYDFETQPTLSILVRVTDNSGAFGDFPVTVNVLDVNEDSSICALDDNEIYENEDAGTIIGNLYSNDPEGDDYSFELVNTAQYPDNVYFAITGTELISLGAFDFESVNEYTLRIRATAANGHTVENDVTVHILNANDAPHGVDLFPYPLTIEDSIAVGTEVATIAGQDVDLADAGFGEVLSYTLVEGTGDTHNSLFQVVGNSLRTNSTFDSSVTPILYIRLSVTDLGGIVYESALEISCVDFNTPPTDIVLNPDSILENEAVGTLVGDLSAIDINAGDSHTFELVSGAGDEGNGQFSIVGTQLFSNAEFDYEIQHLYSIRVKSTDSKGGTFTKPLAVHVIDDPNEPETYTVTLNSLPPQGGSTTGAGSYISGSVVELTATPAPGDSFAGWAGDIPAGVNPSSPTITIVVDSNKVINAMFNHTFHLVNCSVDPPLHGYVTGGGIFPAGANASITASHLPAGDLVPFSHWRVNGVDLHDQTGLTLNIDVTQDMNCVAVFNMGLPECFTYIPGGSYTRDFRGRNEHRVEVSPFYTCEHEITKDMWYSVHPWSLNQGYAYTYNHVGNNGRNLSHQHPDYLGHYPVTGIRWYDMVKWCNAYSQMLGWTPVYYMDDEHTVILKDEPAPTGITSLNEDHVKWRTRGFRLPTQAEWERAARGGLENLLYPNGDTIDPSFAYYNQPEEQFRDISSATEHNRLPNGFGLYDMAGNAKEATWDWYSKNWYANPLSRIADNKGPRFEETGTLQNYRTARGGSGNSDHKDTRISTRRLHKTWYLYAITFRPVFPAPNLPEGEVTVSTPQAHLGSVSGGGYFPIGGTTNLVATAFPGAVFKQWEDENGFVIGTDPVLPLTVNQDRDITGTFQAVDNSPELFTILTYPAPVAYGTILGSGAYAPGSEVTLTAIPAEGQDFVGWHGDAIGTNLTVTVTVDKNMKIFGTFGDTSIDSDKDGLSDLFEDIIGSNRYNQDSDRDRLKDGDEANLYGTDPTKDDTDGDGFNDFDEIHEGTDPLDPEDFPFYPLDGLMRHFDFTRAAAYDRSNHRIHGTIVDAYRTTDKHDSVNAVHFNGTSTCLTATSYNGETSSNGRTISGWLKMVPGDSGPIVSYGTSPNTFTVQFNQDGTVGVAVDAATVNGSTALNDEIWHQFIVILPEGGAPEDIILYIDGALEATTTSGASTATVSTVSTSPVTVGCSPTGEFLLGALDDIRLYNYGFEYSDVSKLYAMEFPVEPDVIRPTFKENLQDQTVPIGGTAVFNAVYKAKPAPVITWQRRGSDRLWVDIPGANGDTYTHTNAQLEDSGLIRVTITNTAGYRTSRPVKLNVMEVPGGGQHENYIAYQVGRSALIRTNVTGTPRIYFEWFKDGESLGTTHRSFWYIPYPTTQEEHGGIYHYRAWNDVGEITSGQFEVEFVEPVEIIQQPISRQGIVVGETGSMSVVATGGGTLTYQWHKYNDVERKWLPVPGATSSVYQIPAMSAADAGKYFCHVSNGPTFRRSKGSILYMWIRPAFSIHPETMAVNEYDLVNFTAVATGTPAVRYQWQHFNTLTNQWEDTRYKRSDNKVKVRRSNAGRWRVIATNDAGQATSNEATLTVYYQPVITQDLQHVTVNEGQDVTYQIQAHALDANGANITYEWYHNHNLLVNGPGISGCTTNTLVLTEVDVDDLGNYWCVVSNQVGTRKSRASKCRIILIPYCVTDLEDVQTWKGDILNLSCSVRGTKPITMQWYKDGTPIPDATTNRISITGMQMADAGIYTFIASNPAGTHQQQCTVTVKAMAMPLRAPIPENLDVQTPEVDADKDGLVNLLESAFGSDPSNPNSVYHPMINIVDDGSGEFFASLAYTIPKDTPYTYHVEQSYDGENWEPINMDGGTTTTMDRESHVLTTHYVPVSYGNRQFRIRVED